MVYNRNMINVILSLTERNLKVATHQDTYQYPEEKCNLKGVLEEDEVD